MDDLIARLRARAADAERRTDVRPSQFSSTVRGLDLGSLMTMGRSLAADLGRVVAANQEGRVDGPGFARALGIEQAMNTPAQRDLPPPATADALDAAEVALGVRLPDGLRRVYVEVADGGFGPGEGIVPLARLVARYRELRTNDEMPRGRSWPEGLLPVVSMDPGWDCVEAGTGRVVSWDPEELTERSSEERFRRSFSELAPSVEAWLEAWVGSKTQAEQMAEQMQGYQVKAAREARDSIGRMTP
ncbi:MAG TPA: SMI1/KNR4 family protein, partial [Candidatus Limnocylindrales bacterium]|nr:SMI1/KNR4 family protein [Candidatus Limnocylindrales bacterium]